MASKEIADLPHAEDFVGVEFHIVRGVVRDGAGNVINHGQSRRATLAEILALATVSAEQIQDIVAAFLVAGTGITLTYDDAGNVETIASSGGGGGGSTWPLWEASAAVQPAANFAQIDSRNNHVCMAFDAATAESVIFSGILPGDYAGTGLSVDLLWTAATAVAGNCVWQVAVERVGVGVLDIDADNFSAAQSATTAAPGTSGFLAKTTINIANGAIGGLVAGERFRLKVTRDAANAADTMVGDAQIHNVKLAKQ
jgi:hypothetical protein